MKKKIKRKKIQPDPIFKNSIVSKITNKLILKGKKSIAQKILYNVLKKIEESEKKNSIDFLEKAFKNIIPNVELKSKRIGGGVFSIPVLINNSRGTSLALQFLIKSARKRSGRKMENKLKNELIDAYNNTGNAVKKKDELHKMAEANKAFSNLKNKKTTKI